MGNGSVDARFQAKALWSRVPCGSIGTPNESREYFRAVEQARYVQQGWMHSYFGFERYAGRRILEIGVGQGTDLAQFAERGAICHGIDITARHLELAAKNLEGRGLGADLRLGDATAIPFPDATFDCVYSFGVLHHVPEMDLCMREIERVLKPGGTLLLSLYHLWSKDALSLVLGRGVLRGELWSLGWHGLLSLIEVGADGVTTAPYVRLYSRRDVRKALRSFYVRDISVFQLEVKRLPTWFAKRAELFSSCFGWYVVATAQKY